MYLCHSNKKMPNFVNELLKGTVHFGRIPALSLVRPVVAAFVLCREVHVPGVMSAFFGAHYFFWQLIHHKKWAQGCIPKPSFPNEASAAGISLLSTC